MFEEDQKQHGTETALFNVLWQVGAEVFNGIGVKTIRTSTKLKK